MDVFLSTRRLSVKVWVCTGVAQKTFYVQTSTDM